MRLSPSQTASLIFAVGLFSLVLAFGYITRNDPRDVAAALRERVEHVALPTIVNDATGRRLGVFSEEARYPISIDDVPIHTQRAFLAAEDAEFYKHSGVSWKGILRSIIVNLKRERAAQGGSTITQQLVRQYFLSRDRSLIRKIREVHLALRLEQQLSKKKIFELWLNGIYLGNNAWGVEAAAQHYFRKSAIDLTFAESALLAGLPQAPSSYAPHIHPKAAKARKEYVIGRMVKNGWLDEVRAQKLRRERVSVFRDRSVVESSVPWVTEATKMELWRRMELRHLPRTGLKVETYVDRDWQWEAQKLFDRELKGFQRTGLEGAMAVVDIGTGQVRTLIGGLDHSKSQFNRASLLNRPFGAATFPLIFAWAMDQGVTMLPGSQSLGAAAITSRFLDGDRAASALGYGAVRDRFIQFGLKVRSESLIEQVQGSPLALALAWRTIAGRPISIGGLTIKSVADVNRRDISPPGNRGTVAPISEASSYAIKSWLMTAAPTQKTPSVIRYASDLSWNHWEIAATPHLVAVIWVGIDQRPSGDPDRFLKMKERAAVVMDQWLDSTQNATNRPTGNAPAGISWHLLKTREGRIASVPFPTTMH